MAEVSKVEVVVTVLIAVCVKVIFPYILLSRSVSSLCEVTVRARSRRAQKERNFGVAIVGHTVGGL